jgi:hypothetical protein
MSNVEGGTWVGYLAVQRYQDFFFEQLRVKPRTEIGCIFGAALDAQ